MNARNARILAGLVIPGGTQIVLGRLFDAVLVIISIAGCVGCAVMLASHQLASVAQPASRHVLDEAFLSALWALRWSQEVWILLGVAVIIHVTAAMASPTSADGPPATARDAADAPSDAAAPDPAPPLVPPVGERG